MPQIYGNVTDLIGKTPLLRLFTGERYLSTVLFQGN